MRAYNLNISNMVKYHNVIVYGKTREEVETYFKTELNWGSMPVCISDHDSLIVSYKDEIEKVYRKLSKDKCLTWEEYNKKHPEDKILINIVSWYGTAKEIANLPDIQECLAKAWAAGYRFILGVTDGNNEKLLNKVNIHCECHIELSQNYEQKAQAYGISIKDMKSLRNVTVFGNKHCPCFLHHLLEEVPNKIVASYPESVYLAFSDLDKTIKERYLEIYKKGFNDIYEYEKKYPNTFEPIVMFITHCNDDMAFDALVSRMAYIGFNAGMYFVFCYDTMPEFQSTAYTITSGRIVRLFKDGRMDNDNKSDRVKRLYTRNKKETLECIKKYETGRLFTPMYMDEDSFKYNLENHTKGFFYELTEDGKDIVDIYAD